MTAASRAAVFSALRAAIDAKQPCAGVTIVRGHGLGEKLALLPDGVVGSLGDAGLDERAVQLARQLLEAEKSETLAVAGPAGEVELFVESFAQPPTLLIFGAVHVAQALCRFAKALGFTVIVSDARAKLATPERFPEADRIIQAWPDATLDGLELTPSTYVAILTHDPKFDEPALLGTIETRAAYIGAVGSRNTNRDRRERLRANGVSEESLGRVRGPIGLDIGANTPEEMAISILAEIIAIRHGRNGGPLTNAIGNIRGEQKA